ncbi:MAG: hypothetical protein WC284_02675 [Candidimonas sp.]|jgi:hypothetical protein
MDSRYRSAIKTLISHPLMAEDALGVFRMTDHPFLERETGTPVGVFLSDTAIQDDWVAIPLSADTLYVHPRAVFRRCGIVGVQAGVTAQGLGLLVLGLSPAASSALAASTDRYPGKRLALVVGRTLIAAQTYLAPFMGGRLGFHVGSCDDATTIAQAVTGRASLAPTGVSNPQDAVRACPARWRHVPVNPNKSSHPGSSVLRSG